MTVCAGRGDLAQCQFVRIKVAGVQGVTEVARDLGDLVVEARLPQIGARPADSYEGDGYIIVRHPETKVVHAALDRIINSIRVVTEPAG